MPSNWNWFNFLRQEIPRLKSWPSVVFLTGSVCWVSPHTTHSQSPTSMINSSSKPTHRRTSLLFVFVLSIRSRSTENVKFALNRDLCSLITEYNTQCVKDALLLQVSLIEAGHMSSVLSTQPVWALNGQQMADPQAGTGQSRLRRCANGSMKLYALDTISSRRWRTPLGHRSYTWLLLAVWL